MEKKSIKETKELLEGLGMVAVIARKIAADGKVNASDLQHLIDAAKNVNVLSEAVKDADQVPAELKDLDELEVLELIGCIYKISDEINA